MVICGGLSGCGWFCLFFSGHLFLLPAGRQVSMLNLRYGQEEPEWMQFLCPGGP